MFEERGISGFEKSAHCASYSFSLFGRLATWLVHLSQACSLENLLAVYGYVIARSKLYLGSSA